MSRNQLRAAIGPVGIATATVRWVVFRRARCRCQACGRAGALEVQHVIKRAQGGTDFDLD
jgi:hypothetical protein